MTTSVTPELDPVSRGDPEMLFLLTLGTYRVVTGGHYTGCTGD